MATYPAETATELGNAPTPRTPANGDKVPGGSILFFENANAAVCNVVVQTPGTAHGDLAIADRSLTSIPANTGRRIVAIPSDSVYVDPADGLVTLLTFSVTANVVYYVIRPVV